VHGGRAESLRVEGKLRQEKAALEKTMAEKKRKKERKKNPRVGSTDVAFTLGPLNAAGKRACPFTSSRLPKDASPVLSPHFHPRRSNGCPPPSRVGSRPVPPPHSRPPGPLRPTCPARREAVAAAVTCAGSRQVRPLLRRSDSQMVRQKELQPRPLHPVQ
jgi:hypothetical protein